jgi:hypothetical protein
VNGEKKTNRNMTEETSDPYSNSSPSGNDAQCPSFSSFHAIYLKSTFHAC